MTNDDQHFILKFCDRAHVDVGFSKKTSDLETQYKIYEGELNSGNPAPMLQFLFHSFNSGQLNKAEYLKTLNDLYSQK